MPKGGWGLLISARFEYSTSRSHVSVIPAAPDLRLAQQPPHQVSRPSIPDSRLVVVHWTHAIGIRKSDKWPGYGHLCGNDSGKIT